MIVVGLYVCLRWGPESSNRLSGSKIRLFWDRSILISSTSQPSQLAASEIIKYEKLPVNAGSVAAHEKLFPEFEPPKKSTKKLDKYFYKHLIMLG